jgi:DNA polymerase III delta prime subunit
MTKPFIYKYQPKNLSEFDIDINLLNIIKKLIDINMLNILFIGNYGVGKSSIINAIVREYYKNDITSYSNNVLSINILKEQGITYYRNEVKTFCQTACTIHNKKKFLILDDLDIVNEQSQQVFRNCIDKYSHNVHFIASCSNIQKIINSMQSRLNIFKLANPNKIQLANIAVKIIDRERINISSDALSFIIDVCNSSIRTLINFLEKCKLIDLHIDINLAKLLCTNISYNEFINYTNACKNEKNIHKALDIMNTLIAKGYSVMDILDSYFAFIKNTDLLSEEQKYLIIPLICKYITIFNDIHEDDIELVFFTNNLISLISDCSQ